MCAAWLCLQKARHNCHRLNVNQVVNSSVPTSSNKESNCHEEITCKVSFILPSLTIDLGTGTNVSPYPLLLKLPLFENFKSIYHIICSFR